MNENLELLNTIYENASMGASSLTDLLNNIKEKDNKIKDLVSEQIKGYEKFIKESKTLLTKYKVKPKDKGIIAETMSKMGIMKEVNKDNSDSAIAEMIIEGFTMGSLEIEKLINSYEKVADKKIIKLASQLKEFSENQIEELKSYI